ncbi:DUF4274 domain-containing protein [Bacillus pacificus]|uniref:DUF4274 domain-containing protein n=1 Tax=Bacillus pacificus TaxID=2026187 RepID=A0ABX6HZV0_9BACI|nr:hypothetical protein AT277_22205 [Bacillus cereus]QHH88009.1 DUF4274 domain-containing protein [Bacillus pacificus]KXZ02491.1 hypothetical protein AT276_08425 [Bacillus cereus]MBL3793800.1 DUF4274 domain-containing protein [Bacillus cereus]MBL3854382.1 DUF4274 domain-containing protein [Bacillus cereus]
MENKDISLLEELLYNTNKEDTISRIKNIDNPILLHCFAANHNWNSGFDIPNAILENKDCDLGTGLLMFHYADGYRLLESPEKVSNSPLQEWKVFILKLQNKIMNLEFKTQNISFSPELTKIQIFKLKKRNSSISDILINESPGNIIDIPKI